MKPLIVASVLLLAACAGGGAGAPPPERGPTIVSLNPCTDAIPVSYTHLTLPTKRIV